MRRRYRHPNPVKRAVDRKVGVPVHWMAWNLPLPGWLFDGLLAWHYRHAGGGAAPTRREWARARSRFERPGESEMRVVDGLPYGPRGRSVRSPEWLAGYEVGYNLGYESARDAAAEGLTDRL